MAASKRVKYIAISSPPLLEREWQEFASPTADNQTRRPVGSSEVWATALRVDGALTGPAEVRFHRVQDQVKIRAAAAPAQPIGQRER